MDTNATTKLCNDLVDAVSRLENLDVGELDARERRRLRRELAEVGRELDAVIESFRRAAAERFSDDPSAANRAEPQ